MIIVKLFFYLISPVLFFIIIIFSPFLTIRISFLPAERIGELTYQIEKYHLYTKYNFKGLSCFDIFFIGNIICNNYYLSLIKKKIFLIKGFIIFPTYKLIKYFSEIHNYFKRFLIDNENKIEDLLNPKIVFKKDNLFTKLSNEDLIIGEKFLESLGISKKDKVVLFYVRDSEYLKVKFPNKDYSYHNFRDCKVGNFELGINELISRGYYIFRMGEVIKNDLNIKSNKYINYSKNYRTEFLDIFLSSRCSFIISCGGGFGSVSSITFRKPILYANGVPILPVILDFCEQSIYSIKLHYHKKRKKYLNIKEIIDLNLANCVRSNIFENKNINLIDNNSVEIKYMIEEFVNKFDYENKGHLAMTSLQEKTLDIIFKNINSVYKNSDFLKKNKPKVSEVFINNNKFLLDIQK